MEVMKKSNYNLIFLDFDGVVTSKEEGGYKWNPPEKYGPSKTIIKRLKKLCDDTNSRIIIASNWRKFEPDGYYTFPEGRVQNPLSKLKNMLGDYIIGSLPPDRYISKSQSLELWFEDNDDFKGNYVIFDDDLAEGYQYNPSFRKRFILVDSEFGLTDEICKKAKEILV